MQTDRQTDRGFLAKVARPSRHPEFISGSHSRSQIKLFFRLLHYFNFRLPISFMPRNDAREVNSAHHSQFTAHSFAFTLAEVLIVLGIIGVIAEMTIPTLMHDFQEKVYKVSYKKAYSIAIQAWTSALHDDKIVSRSDWSDGPTRVNNFVAFKSYFKVIKDCNNSNNTECWAVGEYFWGGYPTSIAPAFIDASGTSWSIMADSASLAGATLLIDTNGLKKPNRYGEDRFTLSPVTNDNQITGMPTKLLVEPDVKKNAASCTAWQNGTTTSCANICPSYAVRACYFTSWLME